MTPSTIPQYLDHWVRLQPDKHFASFLDIRGNALSHYTYRTFDARSRSLAASLSRSVGVARGDRVILAYAPGLELFAAFVACTRIGAIPVVTAPPRSAETRARLQRILKDCGAAIVLTDDANSDVLATSETAGPADQHGPRVISTEGFDGSDQDNIREETSKVLFLQYSSGSTGEPKGVAVSHENVIHNCRVASHDEPVGVSWLPQFHDMGMIGYYLFLIVKGGTTIGFSPSDFLRRPVLWFETLSKYAGTITSAPNFGFQYCLSEKRVPDAALEGLDLSSVRSFMNGSEPVDPQTFRRFQERFARFGLDPQALAVGYGLAENTLAVSVANGGASIHVDKRALERGDVVPVAGKGGDVASELMSCGRPLDGIKVRIVNPDKRARVPEGKVGEIWVAGKSTCLGYWGQADASQGAFGNTLHGEPGDKDAYLATGDLGFLKNGEVFVCGRLKDVIILRGRNYFAVDLENAIEAAVNVPRPGDVAAFQDPGDDGSLVVAVGGSGPDDGIDLAHMVPPLRAIGFDGPVRVILVHRRQIIRTSSGKLARSRIRDEWAAGRFAELASHTDHPVSAEPDAAPPSARYASVLRSFALTGNEPKTLAELGLDSLALVNIHLALEHAACAAGAPDLKPTLSGPLLQVMRLNDLTEIVKQLDANDGASVAAVRHSIRDLEEARLSDDRTAMRADALLAHASPLPAPAAARFDDVLLTGGTGFLGPFLLSNLLGFSKARLRVLVRAPDPAAGRTRLLEGLWNARLLTHQCRHWIDQRVEVICGDVARPRLGLPDAQWMSLAAQVDTIVHNAAIVDYSLNYNEMRRANVAGTRELLNLALTTNRKRFHHMSSTIIFGWSVKERLLETDANGTMTGLDFGYAQTKWAAEQLVLSARELGLDAKIYRPSFVTASTRGVGNQSDIVIRILAFMINNLVAPKTINQISFLPVDIAANNMAALITDPDLDQSTFHVTVNDYYNLVDITSTITHEYGIPFRYVEIEDFVQEMRRLCTEDDPVFPLLDFVIRARQNFAAMQHKRYSNDHYRAALAKTGRGMRDATLSETVAGLMLYMSGEGLITSDCMAETKAARTLG